MMLDVDPIQGKFELLLTSYEIIIFNLFIITDRFCRLFATGLDSEGLYRVAGFHDDVEAIRMSFDKG